MTWNVRLNEWKCWNVDLKCQEKIKVARRIFCNIMNLSFKYQLMSRKLYHKWIKVIYLTLTDLKKNTNNIDECQKSDISGQFSKKTLGAIKQNPTVEIIYLTITNLKILNRVKQLSVKNQIFLVNFHRK